MPLMLMEAALLRYFVQREGCPVTRKAILEEAWGLRDDSDTRAIDNFIVHLRRYIEDDPTSPRHRSGASDTASWPTRTGKCQV